MYLSHIPQCTIQNRNVYISVTNALWDMELVHCGICEIGQLSPAIWFAILEYHFHGRHIDNDLLVLI